MEEAAVWNFFRECPEPTSLQEVVQKVKDFVAAHSSRRIVVVTSGGTTVPLERITVRYLDNFSGGGRGSACAEYFLAQGYAVIFLHRRHSLQPYGRHVVVHHELSLLDCLVRGPSGALQVAPQYQDQLSAVLDKYNEISFTSIHEYLYLLRTTSEALKPVGRRGMVFSAAAVSDYYIPYEQMPQHKIQSSLGSLELKLQPVPKLLGVLRTKWAPEAFIVSFKLETDPNLLEEKVLKSLESYGQELVIGNLLSSHKDWVVLYARNAQPLEIQRSQEDIKNNVDIEDRLVQEVVKRHTDFLALNS